ncbi:MAG: TlpA family protein disulfide reductase [Ruminococcaceae bacterium]|nr:TlpA family protein disulfide reductase [Oscillospiraceae bacterium]
MKRRIYRKHGMIALLLLLAICLPLLASCSDDSGTTSDPSSEESAPAGGSATYTVHVETAGGMAMSEIDVYIYADGSLADMKDFAKTDANGDVTFTLPQSNDYAIALTGVAKGYNVDSYYGFTGTSANIVLTSSLVNDEDLSATSLGLGDIMYDFTVTTSDGEELTLSKVLETKKLVILNFWYTTCSWCVTEFPLMNTLYGEYKDQIEIVALNPYPLDDEAAVKNFKAEYELDFPMAKCPSSWANVFGITGYPTSVFIDRYGMISVVEAGAITSKRPFLSAFEHFLADVYKQKVCTGGIGDLATQVLPEYTMDSSENISALINKGDIQVTYRPETEDENAQYIWPFIATEKNGKQALYASNAGIDSSYAILYADVTLKKGQAVGFDYLISSERLCDILYVIVNDEDVFQISGVGETETWQSCYPCVADEDGTYEIALCFVKDSDTSEGDDTVYINNFRAVNVSEIDVDTYLPRPAGSTEDGETYTYVDIVLNEKDGYYHVGKEDGPLLLADLMGYTPFSEEMSVYQIVYEGLADKDGVSLYDKEGKNMVKYFSYASNASLNGICTVNKELSEMLKQVAEVAGFDGTENEWLKICKYFVAYGPTATQLQDPIIGLCPESALDATLGKDVETNYFYYDRAIIPRGMFAEFIPEKSGVYRFTSKSDYKDGIDSWIFDSNGDIIYTYEHDERMYTDTVNVSMVYYMEAGKPYYINMAFWDVYATGVIYYDIEFIAEELWLFRAAAPGYFTYDGDATGDTMYDIITGGIKPELKDGYWYDSADGSLIYADFTSMTSVFSHSITEMIEMGGFDFSKSETDAEILSYLQKNDNDIEKTDAYLREMWGDEYDQNAINYQLEDVFAGRYHGKGGDLTEEIRTYLDKIDESENTERNGCVAVDQRLAEILQLLMDKYTFAGVENSWLKLCYYYDYLGAND